MPILSRWLCRCGLRFHTRREKNNHVKRVHNAGKPARVNRGLKKNGKRVSLQPQNDDRNVR